MLRHVSFIAMLNVIILSVVLLNVVILSAVMLSVVARYQGMTVTGQVSVR